MPIEVQLTSLTRFENFGVNNTSAFHSSHKKVFGSKLSSVFTGKMKVFIYLLKLFIKK